MTNLDKIETALQWIADGSHCPLSMHKADEALDLIRAMKWQDISTAPRDGSDFLGYSPTSSLCCFTVHWDIKSECFCEYSSKIDDLTHWQPKIEPPQTGET